MIRVLSYPPAHDYVDRLHDTAARLVERDEAWPRLPRFWDPAWVRANARGWDVAHVHFTWEQYDVARVSAVLDAHRSAGRPVVWTAHDLDNPHRRDPRADDAVLEVLAAAADVVVALTPGSADRVASTFGTSARVVPHGPIVGSGAMVAARSRPRRPGPTRVLLHAKSLRANLDWEAVVDAAALVASERDDVVVAVDVHDEPDVVAAVRARAGAGVEVVAHPRRGLADLCARIADADLLVLPYRWGTHSGLAELATDLGTTVVATDVGHVAEQVPSLVVGVRDGRVDVGDLAATLQAAADGRRPPAVPVAARQRALADLVQGHRTIYDALGAPARTAVA